jgi:hypothetical protein
MLTGDTADNIPGYSKITGTRVKKWEDLLAPLDDMTTELDMYCYVELLYCAAFWEYIDEHDGKTQALADIAVHEKLTEIGKLLWMKRTIDDEWSPPV